MIENRQMCLNSVFFGASYRLLPVWMKRWPGAFSGSPYSNLLSKLNQNHFFGLGSIFPPNLGITLERLLILVRWPHYCVSSSILLADGSFLGKFWKVKGWCGRKWSVLILHIEDTMWFRTEKNRLNWFVTIRFIL